MTKEGMYKPSEYRRKEITNVRESVYLNGTLWKICVVNSDKPLNDKEVAEAALLATLNQFFSSTVASDKTKYEFARDYFNRLLDEIKQKKI